MKHPEFYGLFDAVRLDGRPFYDLSGMGRYHMTGEHAAIDEAPEGRDEGDGDDD